MKFKVPFTFSGIERLKKKSVFFSSKIRHKKKSKIADYLRNSDVKIIREEYLGITLRSFVFSFIFFYFVSTLVLFFFSVNLFYLIGFAVSFLFSGFIFFSQVNYPRIYVSRKQRNIEKNLLSALEDILVQLNSGIPLFDILVNISYTDYGALSGEFKKAVKRINSGEPEPTVLDDLGKDNPSLYFRRTLWQISNGIVAGSDMAIVIKDSIKALNEEQLIQIQDYGNRLNPLIVMYMLMTVIIPTLSIAFLTILSSMVDLPETTTQLMFVALAVFVVFAQIMFLGLIKSRRPSLL